MTNLSTEGSNSICHRNVLWRLRKSQEPKPHREDDDELKKERKFRKKEKRHKGIFHSHLGKGGEEEEPTEVEQSTTDEDEESDPEWMQVSISSIVSEPCVRPSSYRISTSPKSPAKKPSSFRISSQEFLVNQNKKKKTIKKKEKKHNESLSPTCPSADKKEEPREKKPKKHKPASPSLDIKESPEKKTSKKKEKKLRKQQPSGGDADIKEDSGEKKHKKKMSRSASFCIQQQPKPVVQNTRPSLPTPLLLKASSFRINRDRYDQAAKNAVAKALCIHRGQSDQTEVTSPNAPTKPSSCRIRTKRFDQITAVYTSSPRSTRKGIPPTKPSSFRIHKARFEDTKTISLVSPPKSKTKSIPPTKLSSFCMNKGRFENMDKKVDTSPRRRTPPVKSSSFRMFREKFEQLGSGVSSPTAKPSSFRLDTSSTSCPAVDSSTKKNKIKKKKAKSMNETLLLEEAKSGLSPARKIRFAKQKKIYPVENWTRRTCSWGDIWDDLWYTEDMLAEMKYEAFVESLGLDEL